MLYKRMYEHLNYLLSTFFYLNIHTDFLMKNLIIVVLKTENEDLVSQL